MGSSKEGATSMGLKLLVIGLAVIIVASNAAWLFAYSALRASYTREKATVANMTVDLDKALTALNATLRLVGLYKNLTGIYQNLTGVLNATVVALKAQEAALIYNVSVEAAREGVDLMYMASNLTVEANVTIDPEAKVVYATEAAEAANESAAMIRILITAGQVLSLNQTFMQYAHAAQAAAYNVSELAYSLRNSTNPDLALELAASVKNYYVNVIKAEALLLSTAKALLQARSTS